MEVVLSYPQSIHPLILKEFIYPPSGSLGKRWEVVTGSARESKSRFFLRDARPSD